MSFQNMKKEEIVRKVIEKAIKNEGVNPTSSGWQYELDNYEERLLGNSERIRYILLSHNFAKAFWGEDIKYHVTSEPIKVGKDHADQVVYVETETWQHHLQQMVLEESPVDYLKKFLKEKE